MFNQFNVRLQAIIQAAIAVCLYKRDLNDSYCEWPGAKELNHS